MSSDDVFWKLTGANNIGQKADFYSHLQKSDHLKQSIYGPDILDREVASRSQKISGKTFEKVSFSKTTIDGLIFNGCKFVDCQFIGSKVIDCEFHDCEFVRTNTHKISFERTYIDPASFKKCLNKKKHQNVGVHLFQVLLNNSKDEQQVEFERDAHFFFLRWKRYQETYSFRKRFRQADSIQEYLIAYKKGGSVFGRLLWEKVFGCGIRLRYYAGTLLILISLITLGNYMFRAQLGLTLDGNQIGSITEALYYTTVSLTTVGYGDITPTTDLGRFMAVGQSILGFSLFALLASMLFRKVSP